MEVMAIVALIAIAAIIGMIYIIISDENAGITGPEPPDVTK